MSHPESAAVLGLQTYLEAPCRAFFGHWCMLAVKSSKEFIEYSTRWTKYAVKSVEGLSDDWVSGAPSGWDAAFSWLTKCQHSAAQMATTLTRTPLMRYSCCTKVVTVHTPDAALNDEVARNYLQCAIREESMSFSTWCLRFRTSHTPATPYVVAARGGTACAFQITSFYKDAYFGQWIVFNDPARIDNHRAVLHHPLAGSVPDYLHWFATCLLLRSVRWIREEVSFRGWKKYLVESTLSYSQSLILTCDLYLSGNIAGGHLHSVSEIGPLELSFDQRDALQIGTQYLQDWETLALECRMCYICFFEQLFSQGSFVALTGYLTET